MRLANEWDIVLRWLGPVGPVTALTRSAQAAIEQRDTFARVQLEGTRALVGGRGIELRAVLSRWHVTFAVTVESPGGMERRAARWSRRDPNPGSPAGGLSHDRAHLDLKP